jgi:hypothetical protein
MAARKTRVPALGTVRVWCRAPGGGGTGITVGCQARAVALGEAALGDPVPGDPVLGEPVLGEPVPAPDAAAVAVAGRCCPAGDATLPELPHPAASRLITLARIPASTSVGPGLRGPASRPFTRPA